MTPERPNERDNMSISKQLKAWRRQAGLSQAEAAQALGLNRRTLQHWEQGRLPGPLAQTAIEALLARHPARTPARK